MSDKEPYSDDYINAFISNELSQGECEKLIADMRKDEMLFKRVQRLKQVRTMVKYAYDDVAYDENGRDARLPRATRYSVLTQIVASIALLIVGGGLGVWLFGSHTQSPTLTQLKVDNNRVWKVVLHVNSNDSYLQKTLLDETEYLLRSYKDSKKKLQVEIVAYGSGINLLRADKSKYINRIERMRKTYSNFSVAACGQTIKRVENKLRHPITLLPNTHVAVSGLRQIILRQKQGWNYIRI